MEPGFPHMFRHRSNPASEMQEKHLEGDGVNSEFSYELKIAGSNLFLIMLTVLSLFILAAVIGGDLVDWDVLGFEVLLPFFCCNYGVRMGQDVI